jgi:hypothetical protein
MSDLATAPDSEQPGAGGLKTVCNQCIAVLDRNDNFCRHCGRITEAGAAMVKQGRLAAPAIVAATEKPPGWTEGPVVVLFALALLGPFAFWMLWRSRRFTRGWKIGLTIAVLAVAIFATWYTVKVVNDALDQAWRQSGLL